VQEEPAPPPRAPEVLASELPVFTPDPGFPAAPAYEPPVRFPQMVEDTQPEPSPEPFGRRQPAISAPVLSPSLHAPAVLLVGLFGAAMFVGALAAMIYGRATLGNLAIGLLGVVCMVPAGLKLLLKVFGERSSFDPEA
jgi:hypothetical protein